MIRKSIFLALAMLAMLIPSMTMGQTDSLWLAHWPGKAANELPQYYYLDFKVEKGQTPTALKEIQFAIAKLNGKQLKAVKKTDKKSSNTISLVTSKGSQDLGNEGFRLKYDKAKNNTEIIANSQAGLLYGVYEWQRQLRMGSIAADYTSVPAYQVRCLNHWDNLDGSVERGYAGLSIWFKDGKVNFRKDIEIYARANASVGINATVLDNVNADPLVLSKEILDGVKKVADILRPYNIKVYLAVNFSSPSALGKLSTSDPLDKDVIKWWEKKVDEIYKLIPDFGGFLVKANSEGLPGPMDFGRTHSDGANMLAKALKPHGGIVMWRAFVYNPQGGDRAKQAYDEFMPLDGKFDDNVIIQIKNGPVDFQPREPFSPLFGAMKNTQIMAEVQITQEYLGYSDHLCYLATMWKEFLDYPTFCNGKAVVKTTLDQKLTAIAGVANTGTMKNWCGYVFAQSNWYAFGRLAWNPYLSSQDIAREWALQTITDNSNAVPAIVDIMMKSREAVTDYMTPLGLHHLMGWSDHYGPQPWCAIEGARPDWMPTYYHKAATDGIGFNRSKTGSNATSQYQDPLRAMYDDPNLCPKEFLLWFHHLPWDFYLMNGNTLWNELCEHYFNGVDRVSTFQKQWKSLNGKVYPDVYKETESKLAIQLDEAQWWRDACLLYFQQFSKMEIPSYLGTLKYKTIDECEDKRLKKAYVDRQKD
ncbi:MAG: alpha-glucuronidase [Bacteroidales bacterium]|nr:alpha-glucuronidase [Bacteroidales bacterium]